jgi:DNA primase
LPQAPPEKYVAEKEVIRIMLLFGNQHITLPAADNTTADVRVLDYVCHEIEQDELEFHHPVLNLIYDEFLTVKDNPDVIPDQYFINHPDATISKTVVDLMTSPHDLSKIWKRYENYFETEEMRLKEDVPDAILALKNEKVLRLLKDAEEELRYAQEEKNEERIQSLQVKFIVLNNLKITLSKGLGDRIIITPV